MFNSYSLVLLEDESSPVYWPKPSEETFSCDQLKDLNYDLINDPNSCSAESEVPKLQQAKEDLVVSRANINFAKAKCVFYNVEDRASHWAEQDVRWVPFLEGSSFY